MNTLHLTSTEKQAFLKLPDALRDGWEVQEEADPVFETPYELMVRGNMAELDGFPELKAMIEQIRNRKTVDPAKLGEIPEALIPEILFTIGARGITFIIEELLSLAKKDEDLGAIAGFSHFRHDILDVNASVCSH